MNEQPADTVAEAAAREGGAQAAARLVAVARAGAEARPGPAGGRPIVLAVWVAERSLEAAVFRAGPEPTALSSAPAATAAQWSPRKVDAASWSSAVAATGWAALHASPAERTDLDAVAVGGPFPGPVNSAAHVLGLLLGAPVVVIQANVRPARAASARAEGERGPARAGDVSRTPATVLPLAAPGPRWPADWRSWWMRPLPTLVVGALVLAATLVLRGPRADPAEDDTPASATTTATTGVTGSGDTPAVSRPSTPSGDDGGSTTDGPARSGRLVPPDCPVQAAVFACITEVTVSDGQLDIAYVSSRALAWPAQGQTSGFPVFHLEGTTPPAVLHPFEVPPIGLRRADGAAATPRADGRFDGRFGPDVGLGPDGTFRLDEVPPTSRLVCIVVYLPVDSLTPGSGNCAALPGR